MRRPIRIFLAFLISTSCLVSQSKDKLPYLHKSQSTQELPGPELTALNLNSITLFIEKDGTIPRHGDNGYDVHTNDSYYRNNGIYAEGILIGGKVYDEVDTLIRVSGTRWQTTTQAGKVLYDNLGNVIGTENPDDCQIWRVRPDYRSADLTDDIESFTSLFQYSNTSIIAAEEMIYNQYEHDWYNWPAHKGAPLQGSK